MTERERVMLLDFVKMFRKDSLDVAKEHRARADQSGGGWFKGYMKGWASASYCEARLLRVIQLYLEGKR